MSYKTKWYPKWVIRWVWLLWFFVKHIANHHHIKVVTLVNFQNQKFKSNGSFRTWREISIGVPQSSLLCPLLCYIYINGIFLLLSGTRFCNFAGDTTLYSCNVEVKIVITRLEQDANQWITWFLECYMNLNNLFVNVILFADDTSIFTVVHEPTTATENLNHDLNLINLWATNGECLSIQTQVSQQ